jgi:hypothetical protein
VALDVDAAAARPAGELGVLPRRHVGVGLAVPLGELLEHHRAGGHVDAQRERLGGEHGLDQTGGEQLLDDLLEGRKHAGVVRGQPALQPLEPLPVAEHPQVLARQGRRPRLDVHADPLGLLAVLRRSPERRHCSTAAAQPARLKMKVMAGRSPSRSSRSSTSDRVATARRRPEGRPPRSRGANRTSSRASRTSSGLTSPSSLTNRS